MENNMSDAQPKLKSLGKALDVLDCFTPQHALLGITEICAMLDLNKSNVFDILKTLESRGYVQQDPVSSKYALGYEFLRRSYVVTSAMTRYDRIVPHLRQLADETGETVYYGVPHHDQVLYLEQAIVNDPATLLASRPMSGHTAPFYCTAIGKAMLAFMPAETVERVLAIPRTAFTETTLVDEQALRADLALTRTRGYALDNMEHDYGIRCVGAPLLDGRGSLLGAISVVGPSLRFTDDHIQVCSKKLSEHCFLLRAKL